jgi:hypothetical protein
VAGLLEGVPQRALVALALGEGAVGRRVVERARAGVDSVAVELVLGEFGEVLAGLEG